MLGDGAAFAIDARPLRAQAKPGRARQIALAASPQLRICVHCNMSSVEEDWRNFQSTADCTAFQTFEWLATWQRHIGERNRVTPAIVLGRNEANRLLFLLPLAIEPGRFATRLAWLGHDLCDYNAPLLAPDFSSRIAGERFRELWAEIQARLQSDPRTRYDWILLDKMPASVGAQPNPFVALDVSLNPSAAHVAHLAPDWQAFYAAKRSAARRRRDRAGMKHLRAFGEIRFVSAGDANDAVRTVETLMWQKRRSLAKMGVPDLFARAATANSSSIWSPIQTHGRWST